MDVRFCFSCIYNQMEVLLGNMQQSNVLVSVRAVEVTAIFRYIVIPLRQKSGDAKTEEEPEGTGEQNIR